MTDVVNVLKLTVGQRLKLANGAEAEIVSNPEDGVWLFVRYLASPEAPERVGEEEMVFAQDVVEVAPVGSSER